MTAQPEDAASVTARATAAKPKEDDFFTPKELSTIRRFLCLFLDSNMISAFEFAAMQDEPGNGEVMREFVKTMAHNVLSPCRGSYTGVSLEKQIEHPEQVVRAAPAFALLAQLAGKLARSTRISIPFVPDLDLVRKCLDGYFQLHVARFDPNN